MVVALSTVFGAPGGYKLEPLSTAIIVAQFLYENNGSGLFTPQHFSQKELLELKLQENYKI